jgi:hypothetical protein
MEIKVGKVYKCGDEKVKIVAVVEDGMYSGPLTFAIAADRDGDCHWGCLSGIFCGKTGREFSSARPNTRKYPGNPIELRHHLKEIVEAKEMTAKEISDKLGYEVKVIKEKS